MIGRRRAASAMGGEDGPADVAVGGHGCQFPPTENKRPVTLTRLTDIYKYILTH